MEEDKKVDTAPTVTITSKELVDLSSQVAVRLSHLKPTEGEFNLFVRMIKIGTLLPGEEVKWMSNGNPSNIVDTNALTSGELIALSNEQIALRLYFVIANGTGKGLTDIAEISNMLYGFAEQLIRKQKESSERRD